jgi:Uma2 family endonuclease
MTQPARKRATYADVLAAPAHCVAEIIDGELVMSPRPGPAHTRAASVLGDVLGGPFDRGAGGPGGWWILDEPELHLQAPGEPIVPDLAGWRVERMPALPDTAYFELAPDWICEVLSASTEARDRTDKMPIYAAAGVTHAWLVDPLLETLEVFRREGEQWLVVRAYRGNRSVRAEPFEAVELDLAPLWRRRVSAPRESG